MQLRRYKVYVSILNAKILADQQQLEQQLPLPLSNQLTEENSDKLPKRYQSQVTAAGAVTSSGALMTAGSSAVTNSIITSTQTSGNRYSYRSNIYRADQQDLG